jgi:putative DNA primase/helicase
MEKIKIIKDTEKCKIGEIVESTKKNAEQYVNSGYAEYVIETKVEKQDAPDYRGFDSFISQYVNSSNSEQFQAVSDGSINFKIKPNVGRKILDGKIKELRCHEKAMIKAQDEADKLAKKRAREVARADKKAEEEGERNLKKHLLDELEIKWETCNDDLFQIVCEEDWRKAKFYFIKRFLKENTYFENEVEIVGIRTFKDNGDIIIYSPKEGIYSQDADIFLASEIERRFGEKATNSQVKEIIDSIKRQTYFDREELQNQPKKLRPVGNGLWDIEGKIILPFSPKYIFLNKITINCIPNANCPKFKQFLSQVLDSEKEIFVLQEWMGYCLINDVRFAKALLLFGDGENGKSVLLKTIKHFLGDRNITSLSLQYLESNPFAPVRLFGKIANIFADLPKKALGQTSVFKMVVSGDSISGEKKGKDSFEFTPYAKMMFSCNEVPRSPDRTRGFFRRWIILKFNQHFPEGDPRRDENLFDKLVDGSEMEGILQFALDGLYRLLAQKGFTEHMSRAEIEDFWLRHSDSVSAFNLDMIEISLESTEKKSDVFLAYENYCNFQNYPIEEPNHFWRRFKEIVEFQEYNPKNDFGTQIKSVKGLKLRALDSLKINNGGSNL